MSATIFSAYWESPSNIALVKYWGKYGEQLPCNSSISFTLNQALSKTSVTASAKNTSALEFDFEFEGQSNTAFADKMRPFLQRLSEDMPWLLNYHLSIQSANTFPHSSGIASSASAYSALALCLCSLHEQINQQSIPDFFQKASYYARIGSGSACRSVYGGFNLWGTCKELPNSANEYAINIDEQVHPVFKQFQDTILIVERGKKSVSSTAGHALLNQHPFAEKRFSIANQQTAHLLDILKSGDLSAFIQLVESEAYMLHAMMMTSSTPFMLMKPNTLAIIEKIIEHRNKTGLHVLFTLDAGANVHVLYPEAEKAAILPWIQSELVGYCQNELYFCNEVGKGPQTK
jgi:diphosphomevalonate decarboxylase